MRRCLFEAQHEMNPTSTEEMPGGFRSGDTVEPVEAKDGWGHEYEKPKRGSVQEGVSMIEPLNSRQPKYKLGKGK